MSWASKLKIHLLKNTSVFICLQSSFFFLTWEKSYEDIYYSNPHVSVVTANILIAIIRFSHYHFRDASNSTFIIDSMYLEIIQIFYYLISVSSVIWEIDTNFSLFQTLNILLLTIRLELFKTNLLGLISKFSKYYFKTGAICLLVFIFTYIYRFRIWLQSFWYPTLKNSKITWP